MKILRCILILAVVELAVSGASGTDAAAEAVIARARAYLGSESALDSVKALRFSGTIIEGTETRGTIVITLKKPNQQRIERTIGDEREITALDEFDAWTRSENIREPEDWRLTLLDRGHIRRLRANNAENLNFFRGAERMGGTVEIQGSETIDGIDCEKIVFTHSPEIEFIRYIDKATGRLVMTETETGGRIRERGEQWIAGIRFPTSLESTFDDRKVIITFDSIEVNGNYPDSLFEVPTVLPVP